MFNFTLQGHSIHSDITGTLDDPSIIITIDKETRDVTWQKVGEYYYLKEYLLPKYDALRDISDVILLAIDTMPLDKYQQSTLLNHITNVTLSSFTKQFIQQLFEGDVQGCRETVNNMYRANKEQVMDDSFYAQVTVTPEQWGKALNAFKDGLYTGQDVITLVQAGLNVFDDSVAGKVSDQMLRLFNKARYGQDLTDKETSRIQIYYKTLEQDNFHTELQATEMYTGVVYL